MNQVLAETIHVGFKTTFCKSKIKKISVSAFDWYRKPGISGEKANETVHHGRNVSEKKKVKPSKELLTFLSFTETTENFLYHCCTWITIARPPPER